MAEGDGCSSSSSRPRSALACTPRIGLAARSGAASRGAAAAWLTTQHAVTACIGDVQGWEQGAASWHLSVSAQRQLPLNVLHEIRESSSLWTLVLHTWDSRRSFMVLASRFAMSASFSVAPFRKAVDCEYASALCTHSASAVFSSCRQQQVALIMMTPSHGQHVRSTEVRGLSPNAETALAGHFMN